jgi:tyrosine-protein phosphatase non-receptor type 12/18/22
MSSELIGCFSSLAVINQHKCEVYWPSSEGEEKSVGTVKITLVKTRQVCSDFTLRTLHMKYAKPGSEELTEERVLCQFHYFAWPDHGVPLQVRPLIDMVLLLRDCQASETCPVLVHCSAGCGRTGTICAIDYVWGLLRTGVSCRIFYRIIIYGKYRRDSH